MSRVIFWGVRQVHKGWPKAIGCIGSSSCGLIAPCSPAAPALPGKGWNLGQGCWEHPPTASAGSCQRRSFILGRTKLMLPACERVILGDGNTPRSSGLASSAATQLSELLLPLLWRGEFFFAFIRK